MSSVPQPPAGLPPWLRNVEPFWHRLERRIDPDGLMRANHEIG